MIGVARLPCLPCSATMLDYPFAMTRYIYRNKKSGIKIYSHNRRAEFENNPDFELVFKVNTTDEINNLTQK